MSSNNAPELIRSLVVYAICIPLAIVLGYSLTDITYGSISMVALLATFLVLPLLLKFHYPLLLFSWHASIWLFFVKASPQLWLAAVAISLVIIVLEKVIARETSYISVPSVVWPLAAMLALVFLTAKLNGGMGLHSAGSSVYGGKKYIILILGMLSYFALVSKPIPPEKARKYAALFILGGLTAIIGDFAYIAPRWMTPVFWVFPPSGGAGADNAFEIGVTRLAGAGAFGVAAFTWLIANYGLRGIFLSGKIWRPLLLVLMFFVGTLGGFRSSLFLMIAVFAAAFFAEKIYQTWLVAPAVLGGLCLALIIIPTARQLPFTAQRAMAFLPLNLDPEAVAAAQDSTDWRFNMWAGLMEHEVPDHLWKGKGYALSKDDFDEMEGQTAFVTAGAGNGNVAQQGLALAGDYHNGMLSLVIPLGVYGVVIFLWFGFAGLRVVWLNFKYGRPELRTLNFIMFIMFFIEFVSYLSCVGGLAFSTDINWFIGYLGMSIALNHGVCNKNSQRILEESMAVEEPPAIEQPQLQPAGRV
jgi:hypothetical protein